MNQETGQIVKSGEAARGRRNRLTARVVRLATAKTAMVEVVYHVPHPKYRKNMQRSRRIAVHYEETAPKVGDVVEIISCRPMSKTKHFRMLRVVAQGHQPAMVTGQLENPV